MANLSMENVLRHIRALAGEPLAADADDGQLLERFAVRQEPAAFNALLARHGPMVLGVCRRVLHHAQDAEDVFQATFLLLARKARTIRKRASVGSWLHGVAYRLAVQTKVREARRQVRERQAADMRRTTPRFEAAWQELQTLLDEELQRLPEKDRLPLVLCYLEGQTQEETARQLGWPLGRTLASASSDSTILIWDVAGVTARQGKLRAQVDASEVAAAWKDLASADAKVAYRSIRLLIEAPERSVPLLRERLRPAPAPDAKRIEQLLRGLDSNRFTERENASKELERLADVAAPALRKLLAGNPSLEVRRRAEELLAMAEGPVSRSQLLRALRSVEALEHIGTADAQALLKDLAKGAAEARLTQEAKASLDRLAKRPGAP